MGLRERASDYSKTTQAAHGIDLGLELRPDLNKRAPAAEPSPTVQPAKQPGLQQKAEAASVRAAARPDLDTAAQAAPGIGHKSQLDAVLNLIEIYKEFGSLRSAADLWQVIAYSLMAQLGTKNIAIFMEDDGRMQLRHALGFTFPSDFSFSATGKLCKILSTAKKPEYVSDLQGALSDSETRFLDSCGARYAAPVLRYEELRGVILINPPQGEAAFKSDDVFYLKVCGELLGAMESQLQLIAGAEEKRVAFSRAQKYHDYAAEFVARLGRADNNEPLKDILEEELAQHYPDASLLLMTREDFFLRTHLATGFQRDHTAHLEVGLVDSIIEKTKQGQQIFTAADFEESEAFSFLARYRQIYSHKILHRQEILAVAFIAETETEKVTALRTMLDHYVMQNHTSKLRDHATASLNHADNPVMAIRNFIAACEEHLQRSDEPFAVVVSDIANYTRLHNLHGDSVAAAVRDFTRRTLREIMESQDFSTEVFHGHFVSVLRQKEAGDAWRISRMLQKQAAKQYPDEDLRPVYQHKIYARPHIQTIPFELLFKG
jgi:GGDEF domain-containing protein